MNRSYSTVILTAAILTPAALGSNLIVNGDFENPTLTGINSDYLHTPGGNITEGTWWVNPWDVGMPWHNFQHGGVGAMSVNGDDSTSAGVLRVWYQNIAVVPGQTYNFSAWALGTAAGFGGYSLSFAFDGVPVGGVMSPSFAYIWEPFATSYLATGTTVQISIVNVSGITFPNDFMLDDLSFTLVPAPGAAALLGLGGLLTSRRRR